MLGESLKALLSNSSPYSEDMEKWQKKYNSPNTGDTSPKTAAIENAERETTPSHMKEYFEGVDDEGHVQVKDSDVPKSSGTPLEASADSAAKSESEMRPFSKPPMPTHKGSQNFDKDVLKSMRMSILSKMSGEYY